MFTAIEDARIFLEQIDQHQLVAVIGQRDLIRPRRYRKRYDPPNVQAGEPFRLGDFVSAVDLQRLYSLGVGNDHQSLAVVEPLREPESPGCGFTWLTVFTVNPKRSAFCRQAA